ncbi:MAG TPA: M4 family metallopeptidase, partial [Flavisolibacter sp.]
GHGVCSFTSDLVYESESGAMNEGLSDIWAAAVERYAKNTVDPNLNYQFFQIGEQISADNIGLRRMDNPKAKTDPDTYGGRYWANPDCVPSLANDQCGVHTNSGVLNKWFYLMVQGPSTTTGSPGYTDDGIADKPRTTPAGTDWVENAGNNYGALPGFTGIGFDKAEQITYLMELNLTPNAKFADARAASILAAKVLYGPCSPEEINVTNAWYGVNVGAAWSTCTAPTLSVNLIDTTVTEGSGECGTFSEYTIGVSLAVAQGSATTINFTLGGTAEAHDYQLSATSITYAAGEMGNRTIKLRIYNDDMVEGDETIVLTATSASIGFNYSQTITILDDDVLPKIGNTFTLLTQNFETVADDNLPAGWDTANRTNPTGGLWNVRSPQPSTISWTTKRAYIYNPALPINPKGSAMYDITVSSNVVLRTPLIDARGLDSVRLQFVWSAGGEAACDPACDYGEVVYSLDGINFNRFDVDTTSEARTASEPLYLSPVDSTYNQLLPRIVSNRQFYLGFRWVNDDLLATSPASSITIDNIVVTGQGRKVESDSAASVSTPVHVEPGNPVYFYSKNDKGLLSRIINASVDLGCVKDTLIQTGNGTVPYSGGRRTRKVNEITPAQNSNATYTLTLYYTIGELAGFSVSPSQLRILKSNAANIDNSTNANSVVVTPSEFIDSSSQGFYGYSYTFNGFSKFALVEPSLSPLPVNCLDFKAIKNADQVSLIWKVSNEILAGLYEIERSTDGTNFQKLAAVSGNGTGQYSYADRSVAGLKAAYYRVKSIEADGTVRYLCTVLYVSFDGRNIFTIGDIYPNPGKGQARVNITISSARKLQIDYLNTVGQLVNAQQVQLQGG